VTWLVDRQPRNRGSNPGTVKILSLTKSARTVLESTYPS